MAENKKLITADNSFLTYMGRIDFSDKTESSIAALKLPDVWAKKSLIHAEGILRISSPLMNFLGQTGINVIMRIMGLILCALGIEFIIGGLRILLPGLAS